MTRVNDYLWHLPHAPEADDPPDVGILQQAFNAPIVAAVSGPLGELGYTLKSSDVLVKLEDRFEHTADTYYANVRFIAYLEPDVILRVHFEHTEWAQILVDSAMHRFFINLDRFKIEDARSQRVVPAWPGRLHTRMSSLPGEVLHHSGEDQIWRYTSAEELEAALQLFVSKFVRLGHRWLTDRSTM